MCVDTCTEMCIEGVGQQFAAGPSNEDRLAATATYHVSIDVCKDMYIGMCISKLLDSCTDMYTTGLRHRHVCRVVCRHLYKLVCRHVCIMCTDMCTDMRADMCMCMCIVVYRPSRRLLPRCTRPSSPSRHDALRFPSTTPTASRQTLFLFTYRWLLADLCFDMQNRGAPMFPAWSKLRRSRLSELRRAARLLDRKRSLCLCRP